MILISALWITYFFIHSLFAADPIKRWFRNHSSRFYAYYRIGYNIIALTLFFALFTFQKNQPDTLIATPPRIVMFAGIALLLAGAVIILLTFKNYSLLEFTGLQTVKPTTVKNTLNKTGLNAYVRHPIYSGTLVALLGFLAYSFTFNTLIFVIIATSYLFVGSVFEERKLVQTYGNAYLEYKKNVPRIIPKFIR